MGQKIRKIQIGRTVFEEIIEVPDTEPKRRTRKPKETPETTEEVS